MEPESYAARAKRFRASAAWKGVRYKVLKRDGGRCQCCGRTAKDGVVIEVDHITPLSVDWSKRLDMENLQTLCRDENCIAAKGNRDQTDWRPRPQLVIDNAA